MAIMYYSILFDYRIIKDDIRHAIQDINLNDLIFDHIITQVHIELTGFPIQIPFKHFEGFSHSLSF
jgi:hypothetical protein